MNGRFSNSDYGQVMALDVGTTTVRCHLYDKAGALTGSASQIVNVIYSHGGQKEIEPETLWNSVLTVCKNAVKEAGIQFSQVNCLGISCQRNTFVTWNKRNGKPYHNFVTWNDMRSADLCKEFNRSLFIKSLRAIGQLLYFITRKPRFITLSILKFVPAMVVLKLVKLMHENSEIKLGAQSGHLLYGTIDTWLIWKFTLGKIHATDPSNACVTGLFDPFDQQWSTPMLRHLGISKHILPKLIETNGDFGCVDASIFGAVIPIRAAVGDQQSAMFGQRCFTTGELKCTLGTGGFLNINTEHRPHASFSGMYPVIAWKLLGQESATYASECATYDVGICINWALNLGLFREPSESEAIARSVSNSGGVYFVPSFSGLQAPINDPQATSTFIGITPETRQAHLVRAILESIAFRVKQLHDVMVYESGIDLKKFCIDGGVARNDFIVQLIADLIGKPVYRSVHNEMSARGAAFLAGLSINFWSDTQRLEKLDDEIVVFQNNPANGTKYNHKYHQWQEAVKRSLKWFS